MTDVESFLALDNAAYIYCLSNTQQQSSDIYSMIHAEG